MLSRPDPRMETTTTERQLLPSHDRQSPCVKRRRFAQTWSFSIVLLLSSTLFRLTSLAVSPGERDASGDAEPAAVSTIIGESVVLAAELPTTLYLRNVSSVVVHSEYESS